jgi:uncharacterized membrane protein
MVIAALAGFWATTMGRLVLLRHDRFQSLSFDMGIFDQSVWLLAHGHSFITVRGLNFFGHHANFGLFLFVPFYWLGAGVELLNLAQVASIALAAVPVYLLARDRIGEQGWLAVVLAAAFLLHPSLSFFAWELFHPEVMAIPALLMAWWLASQERWGWFAACCGYALVWKEDVAFVLVMFGIVLALRRHWRPALVTAGAGVVWALLVTEWMLPAVSGGAFYAEFYADVGGSPGAMMRTIVTNPTTVLRKFGDPQVRTFVWQLGLPMAFLAVLAPAALFVGAPQLFFDVVSDSDFTHSIHFHYAALPLVGVTLGTIEAIGSVARRRSWAAPVMVGAVAVASVWAAVLWGITPIGRDYDAAWWPLHPDPVVAEDTVRNALALIPADASVTATYKFVPHLSHRRNIYDWPNPFIAQNWATRGEELHDPATVEWLVIDRRLVTDPRERALLAGLVSEGEFEPVLARETILVARRPP